MTDKELIQVLRYCVITDDGCAKCPAHGEPNCSLYVEHGYIADRLEALLAENERLKAQMPKWLPASEPPKETGAFLVDLRVGKALLCFTVKDMPFVPAGSWYRVDDFGYPEVIRKKEIKCWMPLPSTEGVE